MKNLFKSISFVVMFVVLGGLLMSQDGCQEPTTEKIAYQQKVENVRDLMTVQPAPYVDYSMDRYLLGERLTRFNNPNKFTYLYVVLTDGTWLEVTIIGKLASTTKRLTAKTQGYYSNGGGHWGLGDAPDEMGVYGSSVPAKVGMTTLGSLLEIGGFMSFIYSETPLIFKNLNRTMVTLQVEATEQEKKEFREKLETIGR